MKRNQKLRYKDKKKKAKDSAKGVLNITHKDLIGRSIVDIEKKQVNAAKAHVIGYEEIVKSGNPLKCISVVRGLRSVKADKEAMAQMDTRQVPYKIPGAYSLQEDMEKIAIMKNQINVLRESIQNKDRETMASDWEKVGRDLNGAICRSGRSLTEKTGWK